MLLFLNCIANLVFIRYGWTLVLKSFTLTPYALDTSALLEVIINITITVIGECAIIFYVN